MAIPIANFGFSRTGLNVVFSNLSFNTDNASTYTWDFGDGTSSTLKIPPTHSFGSEGFFLVSLIVTNGTDIDTIQMNVGVGTSTSTLLSLPIYKLVEYYLPSTLTAASKTEIIANIQTWQLYIQPLVENPDLPVADVHNESKWQALVNVLIGQLVAYDILIQEAAAFMATLSSTTSGGTTGSRQTKSIETGPTRVEWFNDSETLQDVSKAYSNANASNGIISLLKDSICQISSRVRIYLPICGQLKHSPTIFKISTTPIHHLHYSSSLGNMVEQTIYIWSGDFNY